MDGNSHRGAAAVGTQLRSILGGIILQNAGGIDVCVPLVCGR
jgi:hypothetical protein